LRERARKRKKEKEKEREREGEREKEREQPISPAKEVPIFSKRGSIPSSQPFDALAVGNIPPPPVGLGGPKALGTFP
jgi:hypothetical protein